jgi:hypothetical protein
MQTEYTLKKEVTCPSITSIDFQHTTQRRIPEDRPPRIVFCPTQKEGAGMQPAYQEFRPLRKAASCVCDFQRIACLSDRID